MTRTKKSRHKGGIVKVRCNTQHWKDVWRFANEHIAVSQIDKMDSRPVGLIRLMDLKMVAVAGILFALTLRIRGIDGLTVDYRAHVLYRFCAKVWEVPYFSKIEGSERGRHMPMLVSGEHMRIKNPFWSYKKVLNGNLHIVSSTFHALSGIIYFCFPQVSSYCVRWRPRSGIKCAIGWGVRWCYLTLYSCFSLSF